MNRVGKVAWFGLFGLLAEVFGGFPFGFGERGGNGFGFGLERCLKIFESFEISFGAFERGEVVLVTEGEVGLKGEVVSLLGSDFEFVGRREDEGELSFGGVRFDFELRWFGMGKVGEGDGDVAFDLSILGEGKGDLQGLSDFMGEGGGGGEDKGGFFGVDDAERDELGKAGVVAFDIPVSDMPR